MTPYMLLRQKLKIKGKAPVNNQQEDEDEAYKNTEPKKAAPKAKTVSTAKSPIKKRIKKVSKKRAKQNRQYAPVRKKFLQQHSTCEARLDGCEVRSSEIHHTGGRENGRLLKIEDFKALCGSCHRKITDKSREAIASGLSKTRLGKPDRQIPGNVDTRKK